MQDIDLIKVLNRRELVKLLGISERSLQRLEALGDCPPKTRLSEGRVGYRVSDVAAWLDARRETSTARAMIDFELENGRRGRLQDCGPAAMSDHQETLAQVVKRIDTSFDKIKQYNEKADQVLHLGR